MKQFFRFDSHIFDLYSYEFHVLDLPSIGLLLCKVLEILLLIIVDIGVIPWIGFNRTRLVGVLSLCFDLDVIHLVFDFWWWLIILIIHAFHFGHLVLHERWNICPGYFVDAMDLLPCTGRWVQGVCHLFAKPFTACEDAIKWVLVCECILIFINIDLLTILKIQIF